MELKDRFREIFDKSPIGILIYDKKGNLIDINQSAQTIGLNYKLEDSLDKNIFDNPNIAPIKERLLKEGLIEFQVPLNPENIYYNGYDNSRNSDPVLINWIVSVTDSGFLVKIQDINERKIF